VAQRCSQYRTQPGITIDTLRASDSGCCPLNPPGLDRRHVPDQKRQKHSGTVKLAISSITAPRYSAFSTLVSPILFRSLLVNPFERRGRDIAGTARGILSRLNEISFNAPVCSS